MLRLLARGLTWTAPMLVTGLLGASPAAASVTVAVTSPSAGAVVTGAASLDAEVGGDGPATQVKWYIDGVEVAWDGGGAPWSRPWDSTRIADGAHRVFAKATGGGGTWASSPSVSFTTQNVHPEPDVVAPTVSVSAPSGGATVTGDFPLAAKAFDDTGVTRMKWFVDGAQVAYDGDGAPWGGSWDSRAAPNGSHSMFAKARDAAGNWGTSRAISFRTDNPACGTSDAAPLAWQHVVWIVFENKRYSDIVGAPAAPYLNGLAAQCGSATEFHASAHPSLPNYLAMTSGSTQGVTDDSGPGSHPIDAPSIFSQLGPGGWKALQESMPSNCALSSSGLYAARHNPAAYFVGIRDQCATQDVPLGAVPDLSAPFTFVTPNLCHDMHSSPCASDTVGEVRGGDQWLSEFLPKLLASREYRSGLTAIFITWDEDDYSADQHVPTFVVAPSVRPATAVADRFDHYSLLRTTEEMLRADGYLGQAATATSMQAPFGL